MRVQHVSPVSEPANSTAPMFRSLSWRAISAGGLVEIQFFGM